MVKVLVVIVMLSVVLIYNACVFENCEFAEGYEFDTTQQTSIVFKNCTYGGVKITAENAETLASGGTKFFCNGAGSVSFQ